MKRILVFLILCVFAVGCIAKHFIGEFEYKGPDGHKLEYGILNSNEVRVYKPQKGYYTYERVIIPPSVTYKGKEYKVTSISKGAFNGGYLKYIDIPSSIKSINKNSFRGSGETRYGQYPKLTINIHDIAAWCNMSIEYYDKSEAYLSYIYDLCLDGKLITHLEIPEGVTELRLGAFNNNRSIESVSFPNSLKSIGYSAFYGCSMLNKVTFPKSLKRIGDYTFAGCPEIRELTLPDSLVHIGAFAFLCTSSYFGKSKLSHVVLPENLKDIGKGAFEDCPIEELTLPSKLTSIGESAFAGAKISKLIIPSSVRKVATKAFANNLQLEELEVDPSKTQLETKAFEKCKKLKKVQWSAPFTKDLVDNEAFYECPYSLAKYKQSFSYFLATNISHFLDEWQKKGEYESTEQWKKRVNVASRDEEVKKMVSFLRKEYLAKQGKKEIQATIKSYDADSELFTIMVGTEIMYVKVPRQEAPTFKAGFKPEYIQTEYDIVNDYPSITGRKCKIGNKEYAATNQYAKADNLNDMALKLPPLEMDFGSTAGSTTTATGKSQAPTDRSIDQNIPSTGASNANTFAVIIGNENYSLVAKVPYAKNDAQLFAEYCRKTLGMPAKNVRTYGDATYAMMRNAVNDIKSIAKAYNGNINVVFYYAGHGVPNEQNKDAFLLPIDADGKQTDFCYALGDLYKELGSMDARNVLVLMDACFSGSLRGDGMLASARGVALKPKTEAPQGKMVVITATTGDETAYPYTEKGHGMFTYFLLKKLRDTKGNCTLGDLSEYITTNVRQQSVVVNRKSQTPSVATSQAVVNEWRDMKLR